jgi:hypothetical protein
LIEFCLIAVNCLMIGPNQPSQAMAAAASLVRSGASSMQVVEYQDGRCRCAVWKFPDRGWEDVALNIDGFLAHAIRCIATEYAGRRGGVAGDQPLA